MSSLPVLEAGSPQSRGRQAWFLLKATVKGQETASELWLPVGISKTTSLPPGDGTEGRGETMVGLEFARIALGQTLGGGDYIKKPHIPVCLHCPFYTKLLHLQQRKLPSLLRAAREEGQRAYLPVRRKSQPSRRLARGATWAPDVKDDLSWDASKDNIPSPFIFKWAKAHQQPSLFIWQGIFSMRRHLATASSLLISAAIREMIPQRWVISDPDNCNHSRWWEHPRP